MPRDLLRLNVLLEATAAWGRSQSFEDLVAELPRAKWVIEFAYCVLLVDGSIRTRSRVIEILPAGAREINREALPSDIETLLKRTDDDQTGADNRTRSSLVYVLESGSQPIGAICFVAGEAAYDYHDMRFAQFIAQALGGVVDRLRARENERAESDGNRRKDEFLAMLGHELRNPLAPMVTAIELLKRGQSPTEGRLIAVLERQTSHMKRLVDDVLDISRIQRGMIALERRPLDIADVTRDAVEMVLPTIEEQHHRVVIDLPSTQLFVNADPARLTQILTNLLTNASKYSEPGKEIVITGELDGGLVRVTVADQGYGIPAETLPTLFDMFVQGSRTLERSPGGLGLGLPVALALAKLHGGTLTATSRGLGEGSAFTLALPLIAPPSLADETNPPALSTAPIGLGPVLIVDDNADAADLLADGLRAHGHDVITAYDADQALELIEQIKPSAAVLDLGLPIMDGFTLARTLRQRRSSQQMRLIALTGYGQESDRAKARAAGFDAHVVKPADLRTVHDLLVNLALAPRN